MFKDGATKGSRGLSMFYLKLRNDDGQLNNIQVNINIKKFTIN